MQRLKLTEEALECRIHARRLREPERKLLLKIADTFEEIASCAEARRAIEATRCW